MKYIFDSATFKLISTVGSELWVVGDNNTKTLEFHFTDTENIDNYECRAVIKRADGETTNEIICTPVHSGSENYYKLVIGNWITEISGSVDITVRRKKYNTVTGEYDIISYGVIKKDVGEGVNPDAVKTILDEQYLGLLTGIADMQPNLIPKITDLDTTVLNGVYQFEHGYLVVNNNKQLKITAGPLERRELIDGVWSAWSDKIVINSSIIADYLKINNIDVEQNAIFYGNLNVHDGINVNDDFIKNVATPVVKGDAANKGYVDLVQKDLNITKNNLSYLQEALLLTGEETVKFAEHANDADNSIKAAQDQNGNVINTHYGTKQELTTHNENTVAHLFIRQLIEVLEGRMDRFEGRGKSQGVLNYLQSELVLMSENDRNTAINTDIASDFIPTNGDLVYTKDSTMENTHEWEYNGITWVDNGAYTVQKASNDIFGLVKGNNGYVNIVNGLIEVLKSDNTDKIGEYTYNDIKTFLERLDSELDNVYTKEQTYTKSQIDMFINNLKTIYGWEENTIKGPLWSPASEANILKSEYQDYDYLIVNKIDNLTFGNERTDIFNVNDILELQLSVLMEYEKTVGNEIAITLNTQTKDLVFINNSEIAVTYNVYGIKMTKLEKLDNLTAEVENIKTGKIVVGASEKAHALTNAEDIIVDRVFARDYTAGKHNKILADNHIAVAKLKNLYGDTLKQIKKSAENTFTGVATNIYLVKSSVATSVSDGTNTYTLSNGYVKFTCVTSGTHTLNATDTNAMVFNLSELGLSTLSVTDFNTRYPNLTYFEGLKSVTPKSIISKSNNLFDKNTFSLVGSRFSGGGTDTTVVDALYNISSYITVKPNTQYIKTNLASWVYFYDTNKVLISGDGTNNPFTTPLNCAYVRTSVAVANINTAQLNEGTTALPYQPYANHTIDLQTIVNTNFPNGMGRLPNGVMDEIDFEVGKGVIRIHNTTLNPYIVSLSGTNVDLVSISKPTDYIGYNNTWASTLKNDVLIQGLTEKYFTYSDRDNTAHIGCFTGGFSQTNITLVFTKGTFIDLNDVKSKIGNNVLTYQLATPTPFDVTPFDNTYEVFADGYEEFRDASNNLVTVGSKISYKRDTVKQVEENTAAIELLKQNLGDINSTLTGIQNPIYEFYSQTAFSSVTRVAGKIYGVYATNGVITWYYGNQGI